MYQSVGHQSSIAGPSQVNELSSDDDFDERIPMQCIPSLLDPELEVSAWYQVLCQLDIMLVTCTSTGG